MNEHTVSECLDYLGNNTARIFDDDPQLVNRILSTVARIKMYASLWWSIDIGVNL